MNYGLIGEHLSHSFSKEIHEMCANYTYELCELTPEAVADFMQNPTFAAINVTIPYKQTVMPYLCEIHDHARRIGAVNTVVNQDGKLYGYNTDFYGMTCLIEGLKVDITGKKVLILGTGGTSKTATAVVKALGSGEVLTVSRTKRDGVITYDEAYESHKDAGVIINTTPLGMFPNNDTQAIDLEGFDKLVCVVDAVYNPLNTRLVRQAKAKGIKAAGGLYMLVAQALRASEIFIGKKYPEEYLGKLYKKIFARKRNIILTGMPSSGKTTVGSILANVFKRDFIDTDWLIEDKSGMKISDIFKKLGEGRFRELECEAVKEASRKCGVVIATGGGAVLRPENIDELSSNGTIFFINRPLSKLMPTEDRPLALDREAIEKRYNERYDVYCSTADAVIDADCDPFTVAERILKEFYK